MEKNTKLNALKVWFLVYLSFERAKLNRRKAMKKNINLNALGDFLGKQTKDPISLDFREIEDIIQQDLPQKANTSKWWSNNAWNRRATVWLSKGYRVIHHKSIPITHAIQLQRIPKSIINKIRYSRIDRIWSFSIKMLVTLVTLAGIIPLISSELALKDSIQLIERHVLVDYSKEKETITEIAPKLARRGKNELLCNLYLTLFDDGFDLFTAEGSSLSNGQIADLDEFCKSGMIYAQKAKSAYYRILFQQKNGSIYLWQYEKTRDKRFADTAIEYLESADDIWAEETGNIPLNGYNTFEEIGIDPIEYSILNVPRINSTVELSINYAGLETACSLFDVYYLLIENREYTDNELNDEDVIHGVVQGNPFHKLLHFALRSSLISEIIFLEGHDKYPTEISSNLPVHIRATGALCKYFSTEYIIGKQYSYSYYAKRITAGDFYDYAEYLVGTCEELTKALEDYQALSQYYFMHARLCYFKWIYNNDEKANSQFNYYFNLWEGMKNKDESRLQAWDKYLGGITSGKMLDDYIKEVEINLKNLEFQKSPSLYMYTEWDLGEHYMYKAKEMIVNNESEETIEEVLRTANELCDRALDYFNENTNPRAHERIRILKEEITMLIKSQHQ